MRIELVQLQRVAPGSMRKPRTPRWTRPQAARAPKVVVGKEGETQSLLGQGLGISRRQYARDFVESHAGTALVRVELPRAEKPESAPGADCGTWGHWRSRSVIGQSMAKDCPGDPIS